MEKAVCYIIVDHNVARDAGHQPASPLPKHQVPLELPKFAKYNYIRDLLLLDPIHKVDEMGWPNAAPEPG